MAIDTSVPRTRRALLVAALGAGAATVASALGRPFPTRAGTDGDVVLGAVNNASTTTTLNFSSPYALDALRVASTSGTGSAIEVEGPYKGHGIRVLSGGIMSEASASRPREVAVLGLSVSGSLQPGVLGAADYAGPGLAGWSSLGTVFVNDSPPSTFPQNTGVFGGASDLLGNDARGVYGRAKAGQGVRGESTSGTGVYATSSTGYALRAVGRVKLDKCAGVATIAATKNSVVVAPGIDLVSTSAVVASLMGSAGGTTTVHRCVVNATTNTITIYLTKAATQNVKVAWIVLG